ncbi:MAG: hypothetical protein IJH34_03175 [Romboutsia sp.]|nr:hypothetical protein [Romboutsia sp.]
MYTEINNFLKGYKDENGVMHTEFEYREMNGTDEEAIAKPKVKSSGSMVTRVILERCITRIGSIEKESVKPSEWTSIIQSLAIGDQDFAMLKIREISLGDEFEVSHKCPSCKTKINSVFTLDELPLIPYSGVEEIEFELPRGYKDKEGTVHKFGVLRHANGLDREALDKVVTQNPSMANTLLLARCIKSLGTAPITDDLLRNLSMRDRNYLFSLIRDTSFGYDVSDFEIECPCCERELSISFNQTDFL